MQEAKHEEHDAAAYLSAIVEQLVALTSTPGEDIDPRVPFSRLGLTSMQATMLMAAIAERFGRPLPPTLVWEHPTPAALARFLAGAPTNDAAGPERAPSRPGKFPASTQTASPSLEEIRSWLVSRVGALVGIDAQRIDPGERFKSYGLDSLRATGLVIELATWLGRPLLPTVIWEHPTVEALSLYLAGQATTDSSTSGASTAPRSGNEPIAVIGLACRFPRASSPQAFWELLRDGVDAIVEVPPDRWSLDKLYDSDPSVPGKMSTRWGGFLSEVDTFEPGFFGISPREAAQIDPQQRIALELSWEALEDAGIAPTSLKDSRTGVFFGAMWMDYARLMGKARDAIIQHTATGQDLSLVPGRVSYTLGLTGPSLLVNTACSSSLVAVHLACQSLLRGESRIALVGGVNLILAPESTITMSKFGAMAPDGRSKAFDARANGYVRGEGGGVVVLKRLSDALADGDRIDCVIRGSAINNDGFSNGLTAPSPKAQEAVLREAYAAAGVAPTDVQYVEAHGTGTMLGDPIEAGALGMALGAGRATERALRIGSVKTNIGHLEAAAGMAGLLKVVLAMRHRQLPPSLHYQKPNPHIPFDSLGIRVQTTLTPWEGENGRLLAGVSSFGFSGTNCHVVLETRATAESRLFVLSVATDNGLREQARTLAAALRGAESLSMDELCERHQQATLAAWRLAVVVRTREELLRRLEAFVDGQAQPGLVSGRAAATRPRVAFVFGGQGSQWQGMGRALLAEEAARVELERCDRAMRAYVSWSLLERLQSGDASLFDQTDFVQPAIFAMQIALAAAWRARGLEPDVVVGQSLGEVAAAHVAGALTLDDAARVICLRSQLVTNHAGKGGMAVVGLSLEASSEALASFEGRLSVAVSSGPETTVVAGEDAALGELLSRLQERGVFCRQVRVDYASHSAQMDPLLPELRKMLAGLAPRSGSAVFHSTVTAEPLDGEALDAEYWARNLREPVLFAPTVRRLAKEGVEVFVEVDPHSVLAPAVEQCLTHDGRRGVVLTSGQRDESERVTLLEATGRLLVAGLSVRMSPVRPKPEEADLFEVLPVSARSPAALAEQARRWAEFLDKDGAAYGLRDIVHTAQRRRSHLTHRLALVGRTHEELVEQLRAVQEGELAPAARRAPRVVFVFPGYGAQWLGMGRRLLAHEPIFRGALSTCDAALARHTGWSVIEQLQAEPSRSRLGEADVIQPVTFALQVGLVHLLRSWGVYPAGVVGHSMGEIAAAHVAGVLTLEDAARVIVERGRIVREHAPAGGGMLLVALSPDDVASELAGMDDRVVVGAINAPGLTVLSGEIEAMEGIAARLAAKRVFCRRVNIDYASHSPQMDPLLPRLERALTEIRPSDGALQFWSTVLARPVAGSQLGASYWADNLRRPVRFAQTIAGLRQAGHTIFVEISAHPILLAAVQETLQALAEPFEALACLRRDEDEVLNMRRAAARLYAAGCDLDWSALTPGGGRVVSLPTYPWQRERFWLDLSDAPVQAASATQALARTNAGTNAPATLRERIAAAPARDRLRLVEDHVRGRVSKILGLRPSQRFDPEQGLAELGLSSLMAVELRNQLAIDFAAALPATLAFDAPSVRALAEFVLRVAFAASGATPASEVTPRPEPATTATGWNEPIAVVGLGCRFPGGADDLESFWGILRDGLDLTREVPPERWPAEALFDPDPSAPQRMYVRRAAFLEHIEGFDAAFFRISPREAQKMDPQQRLLLEVAWEAIEHANISPDSLIGSDTGVFVAGGPSEYRSRLASAGLAGQDAYTLTGNLTCSLSGRLSYVFGFQGPTVTLDTGCSASLVALHLACQSLRSGETNLALAGGVNLIVDPEMTVDLCKSSALAPDGRCKTFDASANGYARGEGGGVIVLKRLSDAQRDGDRVLAVVRGTAVNHGGRAAGLTVPSGPAQEALMRKALRQAGVDPAEVGFVETHGTGTDLGDPIEVGALAAVYGRASGRPSPCVLGALKTNIGHLELAAGIAGLIKAVACVQRGELPGIVHLRSLNPKLPGDGAGLAFPSSLQRWPEGHRRRIAAVSSFGVSGTNAHVVLEQAPEDAARADVAVHAGPVLLPLSARTPRALQDLAERYRAALAGESFYDLRDMAYTAATRRAHHEHRLAVVAQDRDEATGLLQAWLRGESRAAVVAGASAPGRRRVAFVFSGQGSQWVGMGRKLYASDPAFRAAIEACDAAIRRAGGIALVDALNAEDLAERLREPEVLQPALFAMHIALAASLRARGIEPDAVVGHSVGEIAAAHVAGALSLEDAATIVCARSRLIREHVTGRGAMAQIELGAEVVHQAIAESGGGVTVAVINAPNATVIAGDAAELDRMLAEFERRDVGCRRVKVEFAAHSPQMDEVAAELRRGLVVRSAQATIPLVSTVTGEPVSGAELDADYWADNLRKPVLFADAIAALARDGVDVFLEISPHPVLVQSITDTLAHHGHEGVALASLRRDGDEATHLLAAIGGLYTTGCALDWSKIAPAGRPVPLPAYPWQRQRYWIDYRPGAASSVIDASAAAAEEGEAAAADRPAAPEAGWLRSLLAHADRTQRRALLAAHLREQLAGVLGVAPGELDPRTPLPMLGLDSLMGTELRRRLERGLGRPLSPTLVLRHPTLDALTAHLAGLDEDGPGDRTETTQLMSAGAWVVVPRPAPDAVLQLVCFHYAGGGASMYREWPELLGPGIEVCAVQLPGREERIGEPPLTSMEPLLAALGEHLAPRLRVPFAFFGHSLGALVAFEFARRLAAAGRPEPVHLFLSGCPGPRAHVPGDRLHDLGDAEFRAALRRHGGTPEAVLADDALMELLAPLLRADFGVAETWDFRSGQPLACPSTGLAGAADPIASPAQVQAFAAETSGGFSLHTFAGGHFFVQSERAAVVNAVRQALAQEGPGTSSSLGLQPVVHR